MGVADTIATAWRQLFGGTTAPSPTPAASAIPPIAGQTAAQQDPTGIGRSLAGGRLSVDTGLQFLGTLPIILPPRDAEDHWRRGKLDDETLSRLSPTKLLELLADLSPDVSKAVWDFLRLCNPGYECHARRPGTEEQDDHAQAVMEQFLDVLADRHGSFDVLVGKLFLSASLRGAIMAELVLDERGRLPLDLAVPDAATARFQRATDPVLGQYWQLGQWQATRFVPLERPTIRYVPIDPLPGSPYGRPLLAPALFATVFLLGILHDLRRVVAQQGYPRIDLKIDLAALKDAISPDLAGDPAKWQQVVDGIVKQVQDQYAQLQPDDAYVHTSVIDVGRPVGTVDASSLEGLSGIIAELERMAMRGLKSMPLLMGMTDGVSEANANRQWEIHVAGIKSIQHYVETLLGRLLTIALAAQGIAADVVLTFAELRAAELLRDQQTEQLAIQNATNKYLMGWISQEEASLDVTGHEPDQPEPRETQTAEQPYPLGPEAIAAAVTAAAGQPGSASQTNPEPGASRGRRAVPLPADVAITARDQEEAVEVWDATMPDFDGLLEAKAVDG